MVGRIPLVLGSTQVNLCIHLYSGGFCVCVCVSVVKKSIEVSVVVRYKNGHAAFPVRYYICNMRDLVFANFDVEPRPCLCLCPSQAIPRKQLKSARSNLAW